MQRIRTPLSDKVGLRYPIVCAPMFIISNKEMIVACAEAGILGAMPSLNARTPAELEEKLRYVRDRTDRPFAINMTIGLTASYRGYHTTQGTRGVGISANGAVVTSMVLIFVEEMIIVQILGWIRG